MKLIQGGPHKVLLFFKPNLGEEVYGNIGDKLKLRIQTWFYAKQLFSKNYVIMSKMTKQEKESILISLKVECEQK